MPTPIEPGASTAVPADPPVTERQLAELLHTRRTVLPRRLGAPGPEQSELEHILGAAAAAPDHGGLVPWRFVIVPPRQRGRLGEVFAQSLNERDAAATPEERGMAREEAFQAPVLMLAIVRLGPDNGEIPATERILSAGCAIQNMLLTATVLGYGSALTTGRSLPSAGLRSLFGLEEHEEPLCFISVGTVLAHKAGPARPTLERYVSELGQTPVNR
ncbi:nitroreductase family protein [Variovorax sp. RA8]|uniref:nitroreductase family protein n=1 Tax=Variovorax sp. (strain JCM 16519 / RA8) TaxID=662548 RepID=UPI000AC3A99A|nr:nitroreductase [Variovorax sp. RA8]VTU21919.1 Putative NAD(P)H nitroreductase YdjA [Variovorax sp. RA8]